jgi:hypothetical protein
VYINVFVADDELETAPKGCKYSKILTENDTDFHNNVVRYLFNCLCMNGLCIFYCCN